MNNFRMLEDVGRDCGIIAVSDPLFYPLIFIIFCALMNFLNCEGSHVTISYVGSFYTHMTPN